MLMYFDLLAKKTISELVTTRISTRDSTVNGAKLDIELSKMYEKQK